MNSFFCCLYIFIKYGSVPLGIAAVKRHTETVQRLLELGANPNHQDKVITDCHIIIVDYTHTTRLKNIYTINKFSYTNYFSWNVCMHDVIMISGCFEITSVLFNTICFDICAYGTMGVDGVLFLRNRG